MNQRWFVLCLVVFLAALPVLAQDEAAMARPGAGCGRPFFNWVVVVRDIAAEEKVTGSSAKNSYMDAT